MKEKQWESRVKSDPSRGERASPPATTNLGAGRRRPAAEPASATSSPADEFEGTLGAPNAGAEGRAAGAASAESPSQAWRPWLAGGSSREVLARIVPEDPLGVREHVARALREGAYLMDGHRVSLRCFALVARHAVRYRGRPELQEWLQILARESIAAILRDDGEAERRPVVLGHEPGREHGEAFAALAKPLGLEAEAMGRACLAFNRLVQADRAAFFALVIAGRTLDELARSSHEHATEIARRARRALDAILVAAAAPTAEVPPQSDSRKGK